MLRENCDLKVELGEMMEQVKRIARHLGFKVDENKISKQSAAYGNKSKHKNKEN